MLQQSFYFWIVLNVDLNQARLDLCFHQNLPFVSSSAVLWRVSNSVESEEKTHKHTANSGQLYLIRSWSRRHTVGLHWLHTHSALRSDNSALGERRKLRDRYVFFRMDRYGFGHALLLRETSVIGMEAGSPPPPTDYSYHLVRFHEAIICLHTPATSGMADYRNTHYTVADGGKRLSARKEVVCWSSSSRRDIKVWGV